MSKKKVVKKQEYVVLVPFSSRGDRYPLLYNYQIRGGIFTSLAAARREALNWSEPIIAIAPSLNAEQRGIIEQQEPSRQ